MKTTKTAVASPFITLKMPLSTTIILALSAAIILLLCACAPAQKESHLAIVDPAFSELFPSAKAALSKAGYEFTVINLEESSRSFFEVIERAVPARIILSPLLAQQIPALVKSRPGLALGALAFEEQSVSGAMAVLRFRGEDAARTAAEAALHEAKNMETSLREPLVAAVFAGADAARRAEAFKSVFLSANAAKLPIVEVTDSDWSSDAASRLTTLDIALFYVSVPPKELGRWLRELSKPAGSTRSSFIIAESPQVPLEPWHNCDAIVYWDMEGSIEILAELLRTPQTEAIDAAGAWHYKKLR